MAQCGAPASVTVYPEQWRALGGPSGDLFQWQLSSSYFVRPPFFERHHSGAPFQIADARPLLVLGDAITTDHISPVGRISPASMAADYLRSRGVADRDLNTYAARRGNHDVMERGTFANDRLKNALVEGSEGPLTRHMPSGDVAHVHTVAERYRAEGHAAVVLAGQRYGSGSARDWAAKGSALLGIRVVIAESFERIHRSNLVRVGILPVLLNAVDMEQARKICTEKADVLIDIVQDQATPCIRSECSMIVKTSGALQRFRGMLAVETDAEVELLASGDLFRTSLSKVLARSQADVVSAL